jgi:succinyl-CoA synthetase alpha subunit
MEALHDAGVIVAPTPTDMGEAMLEAMKKTKLA